MTLQELDSPLRQDALAAEPATDLEGLEAVLTTASPTARRFSPHPEIHGAYTLDLGGRTVPVSFRRDVLDAFGSTVRLLTYLTPELDQLLALAGVRSSGKALGEDGALRVNGATVRALAELEAALAREVPAEPALDTPAAAGHKGAASA